MIGLHILFELQERKGEANVKMMRYFMRFTCFMFILIYLKTGICVTVILYPFDGICKMIFMELYSHAVHIKIEVVAGSTRLQPIGF